jgi:Skp family chaperone for outer membrane proteins
LSRKNLVIAVAALAAFALGGLGFVLFQRFHGAGPAPAPHQQAAAAPALGTIATGQVPAPVFLVMDKAAVVRYSKAGMDIARQMQPLVKQIEASLVARRAALERDVAQLQQEANVTPADRDKRIAALNARQNAINADAQKSQEQLQAALASANGDLSKAMETIIPAIVKSHGANLVLDAATLPIADPNLDITGEVIKQLDTKMTTVKLPLNGLK